MKINSKSVFTALSSYSPQKDSNPRENYTTELLAWYINNVELFGRKYCLELIKRIPEGSSIVDINTHSHAKTQVTGPTKGNIFDMVIDTAYAIKGKKISFICEHKINSGEGPNQLSRYKDCAKKMNDANKEVYVVYLTKAVLKHKDTDIICITWTDIYRFIQSLLEEEKNRGDELSIFLLQQFAHYLHEGDFGVINPINQNAIKEYFSVKEFVDSIKSMFKNLRCRNWEEDIPNLSNLYMEREVTPSVNDKIRWGRYGIDFFKEWNPGLFAGVIFDWKDHDLKPLHEEKGPDFVVLLEANYKDTETYHKIHKSDWLNNLKNRLKESHEPFDNFVDDPNNKYRLAILRKPLFDIIGNTSRVEDQESELAEYIEKGIRLFLNENK